MGDSVNGRHLIAVGLRGRAWMRCHERRGQVGDQPVVEAGVDGQLGCSVVSAALFAGGALGRLADIAVWERRDGGGGAFHLRIVS